MTGPDVSHMLTDAIRRHFGDRRTQHDHWDFRISAFVAADDPSDLSVSLHRNAHPTEGLKPRTDYLRHAACMDGDGSCHANPVLMDALDRLVGGASRLALRDDVIRRFGSGQDDYAEPPLPVRRGRLHLRQPPPWAYSMDRTTRALALSSGWDETQLSVPAGCALDAAGMPSQASQNGLQITTDVRTHGDGSSMKYEGTIAGSVVDARIEILPRNGPGIRCYRMGHGQMIEILGAGSMPETMIQGLIGLDVGEVISMGSRNVPVGVEIAEAAVSLGTIYLTVPRILDPLARAPTGMDTSWMETGVRPWMQNG